MGAAIVARAAIPQQIGYQGSLVDSANQPVNASITMTFKLYNVASGGSALYTESQSVAVTAGQFNAAIGAITPLTLPFDVPYYIGVTVGGDAEMTPRQALAAAPYALRTAAADSVAAAAALPAVQITGTIGTTQIANAAVTAAKLSANYAGSASAGGPATTAVALAANGTNCPPGQLAAGVDAQGNAEGCSTPPAGTVTSVTAGTGLTGGTITATGTIAADATYLQRRVAASCAPGSYIRAIAADGTVTCGTDANSGGTVTSITAGGGLTGGTITGSGTIAVDAASPLLTTNFYKLGGNAFVADPAVLGTTNNSGLNLIVNGTPALQVQPATSTDPGTPSAPNLIGGSVANAVLSGVFGATIGGGGQIGTAVGLLDCGLTCGNNVLDAFGTIGGGAGNLVGDGLGTVRNRHFGTVGGGFGNAAKAEFATVGGGSSNLVSGASSVIAGGGRTGSPDQTASSAVGPSTPLATPTQL
ncbi:MAG: hypothetical protein IPO58_01875 [Betaproteobacteria bacterium]|nr:hypothetical protein [Betaproteobacteria bacterium]